MDKAFHFNLKAKYEAGQQNSSGSGLLSLIKANVQVRVSPPAGFETHFPDVFGKCRLDKICLDSTVQSWNMSPMQFWQNQLNFAVWCATTGCGVSLQDHILAKNPLIQSLYRFHTYYQIRRILVNISTPMPQDNAWNATNNSYDQGAYEKICSEFNVSPDTDWRKKAYNNGLGRVYFNPGGGIKPFERSDFKGINLETSENVRKIQDGVYESSYQSFTKQTRLRHGDLTIHINYINQDESDAETAWQRFILHNSKGFTRPGVERLNDSIRTYVWAILGSQAQTRTGIIGAGAAFDAQKQFLANIEDAISSQVDLPSAIKRYQDVLQYAGSELNFVFGVGLYMAPSDMLLQVGQVKGYNNDIVIATPDQTLGVNTNVNVIQAPPDASNDTGESGLVKPQSKELATEATGEPQSEDPVIPAHLAVKGQIHDDMKTALIVGSVVVGLVALWFLD